MEIYVGDGAVKKLNEMTQDCEERHEAGWPIKCANCGAYYSPDEDWQDHTVCSLECSADYAAYLNGVIAGF